MRGKRAKKIRREILGEGHAVRERSYTSRVVKRVRELIDKATGQERVHDRVTVTADKKRRTVKLAKRLWARRKTIGTGAKPAPTKRTPFRGQGRSPMRKAIRKLANARGISHVEAIKVLKRKAADVVVRPEEAA